MTGGPGSIVPAPFALTKNGMPRSQSCKDCRADWQPDLPKDSAGNPQVRPARKEVRSDGRAHMSRQRMPS